MLDTSEARGEFDRRLTLAGFDSERPDPLLAWQVFKEFAEVHIACAEDALLFQAGVYSFTGEPRFHLDFTRQFTHEEDGEYAGMEQLHCTVLYEPAPELSALEANVWSSNCASLEEFFARVEAMPQFQVPTRSFTPMRIEIDQEEV